MSTTNEVKKDELKGLAAVVEAAAKVAEKEMPKTETKTTEVKVEGKKEEDRKGKSKKMMKGKHLKKDKKNSSKQKTDRKVPFEPLVKTIELPETMAKKKFDPVDIGVPEGTDPKLVDAICFIHSLNKIFQPAVEKENTNGSHKLEEFCPIFKDHFKELHLFAKAYLLIYAHRPLSYELMDVLKVTDVDRYMLKRFSYNVGTQNLKITIIDGMPEGLTNGDLVVAKKILYKSLSNEDKGVWDAMVRECKTAISKYETMKKYVDMLTSGTINQNDNLEDVYKWIGMARESGYFDKLPKPTDEEKKYNHPVEKQEDDSRAAVSINLNHIENLLDECVQSEEIDNLGISFSNLLKVLINKAYSPARMGIIGALIDGIFGIVKTIILTNSEKVKDGMKKMPTINIDSSVDKIDGMGSLLKSMINYANDLKNAETADDQVAVVDHIADHLKNSMDIFESEAFVQMVEKIIAKHEAKMNAEDDLDGSVEVSADNAAMMSPDAAFPQLFASEKIEEDSKPGFLQAIQDIVTKPTPKEKPSFINEVNAVPVTGAASASAPISHKIHSDLMNQYPYLKDICDIAASHGISLAISPIEQKLSPDAKSEIVAIQVVATINGVFSYLKSFTIDLGQHLDARVKVFANCKETGFFYCEMCNEAYRLFDKDDKSGRNIDKNFFNKVFKLGFDGLNENDRKEYRMYNSSTLQLNRIIIFASLPTGRVKGEQRQALKDSAFKMMDQIKKMQRVNNIGLGRFYVTAFDKDSMSYQLTNADTWLNGKKCEAPRMNIDVTIGMDSKGAITRDADGKPIITYVVTFIDNVFDNSTFKYPDGTTMIELVPQTSDETSEAPTDATEVVEMEQVTEEETPGFLKQ